MADTRYRPLVEALAEQIRSGKWPPGTRLPTHRQLAEQHGIALVTATRVYAELEAMGLVSGEVGRGTFVRETSLPPGLEIDQQAVAANLVDLSFNAPSLPGQADLLRGATPLRGSSWRAKLCTGGRWWATRRRTSCGSRCPNRCGQTAWQPHC